MSHELRKEVLVVRFKRSHSLPTAMFANVRITGPLANLDPSGVLDLTFAFRTRGLAGRGCQMLSTGRAG
jgi:hypothetical protein